MDQNKNTQTTSVTNTNSATLPTVPANDAVPKANPAIPAMPSATSGPKPTMRGNGLAPQDNLVRKIVDKVKTSENILVALSRDPSVDEMAAAIGLTLFLDGMQKHTTAIYSGQTPAALDFLQPEGTFENNTDSLQDFIIALSKDKADHLRYKLDGDFVKVYITPYKTTLTEGDLEFSHGDYNVDLVLALGVPTVNDLDAALAEYGRIMHDAMTVDITCDAPGRFGELEWSDPGASSVSEMVTKLIIAIQGAEAPIDKEVATALLTGIVAATERFSNNRTSSDTMQIASKLMTMGADQQLIAAHVMNNDPGTVLNAPMQTEVSAPVDRTNLLVGRDYGLETATPMTGTVVQPDVVSPVAGSAPVASASAAVPTAPTVKPAMLSGAVSAVSAGDKDYGQMMAQALTESGAGQRTHQMITSTPSSEQEKPASAGVSSAGKNSTSGNPAAKAAPAEVKPSAEPVADADKVVLPPPPAPTPEMTADMVPPTMGQVKKS